MLPDPTYVTPCTYPDFAVYLIRFTSLLYSPPDIQKQFSIPPQSVRVEGGGRSEIRCGVPSGLPLPTLQWLKNGVPLVPDESVLVSAEGSVLITHASMQVREFGERTPASMCPYCAMQSNNTKKKKLHTSSL